VRRHHQKRGQQAPCAGRIRGASPGGNRPAPGSPGLTPIPLPSSCAGDPAGVGGGETSPHHRRYLTHSAGALRAPPALPTWTHAGCHPISQPTMSGRRRCDPGFLPMMPPLSTAAHVYAHFHPPGRLLLGTSLSRGARPRRQPLQCRRRRRRGSRQRCPRCTLGELPLGSHSPGIPLSTHPMPAAQPAITIPYGRKEEEADKWPPGCHCAGPRPRPSA